MQPALNLTTTHQRVPVRVNGSPYTLRTIYDLNLSEVQEADRISAEIVALLEREHRTKAQDAELEARLRRVCELALDAPPKVQKSLSVINLLTLYRAFAGTFAADVGVLLAQSTTPAPSTATAARRKR